MMEEGLVLRKQSRTFHSESSGCTSCIELVDQHTDLMGLLGDNLSGSEMPTIKCHASTFTL